MHVFNLPEKKKIKGNNLSILHSPGIVAVLTSQTGNLTNSWDDGSVSVEGKVDSELSSTFIWPIETYKIYLKGSNYSQLIQLHPRTT
jgi:hypothetical protein